MSEKENKKDVVFWKSPVRIAILLCYLLIPSIVISLGNFYSFHSVVGWRNYVIWGYIVLGVGVLLFWVFRLFKTKTYILALVLGLLLSPVFTVIYEAQYVSLRQGMGIYNHPLDFFWAQFSIVFYVIPLTLLVLIALFARFIVIMVRKSIKQTKEMNEKQDDMY